ncbi:MAG: acyl-CoA dehydrogenase family protein [Deltaproteobacteria bacterium]|nr:acyl-CoA dehydrogenase family protein [Deltaproteobacteria bacterium]
MELVLNEEQTMLDQTAKNFIKDNSPISRMRKLRDDGDPLGYSKEMWKKMAELGWTSILFSEEDGGMGLGMAEVVLVTEALGRGLAPEPFFSTVMLAGQALSTEGSPELKEQWLGPIIEGEKVLAMAYQEKGGRFDITRIKTTAKKTGSNYLLNGEKAQVLDGFGADAIIVSARTSGKDSDLEGITLFLIPAGTPGMTVTRQWRLDSRNIALVQLKDVEVAGSNIVGTVEKGGPLLSRVIDQATVALCGEMLGGMSAAFDRTLGYLKERVQFDVVIGTFQALKHRAARMFMEIELSRSAVMAAARALDENNANQEILISTAKARCSEAYILVTNEAVQMLGGIGMTDEEDTGFFMKRARAAEMTFGDAAFHRDRFATLKGF